LSIESSGSRKVLLLHLNGNSAEGEGDSSLVQ